MNNIIFISDYFLEEITGGAELNDFELINLLSSKNILVKKKKSADVDDVFISDNIESFFIISNFTQVRRKCLDLIENKAKYIIYEHDHKYVLSRNPGLYENYKVPKQQIINENFYLNAKAILCQSSYQENIIKRNIEEAKTINLSGNIWSIESLDLLEKLSFSNKSDLCSIVDSSNWHKNTKGCLKYCIENKIKFDLVKEKKYLKFLESVSKNGKIIFLPKTPETLSRIVVESRMMNISVITNDKVGATYEDWFHMKGSNLIAYMRDKRQEILLKILELIN